MKRRTWSTGVFAAVVLVLALLPFPAAAAPSSPASPAEPFVQSGQAALAASDFPNAEKEFRSALGADPNYAPAYSGLAQTYAAQSGREKDALANAQRAADLAPKDGRVLALLADVQLRQYTPAALEAAEQAAALSPDDAVVQAVLALAYLDDSRWEQAHAAAARAVELDKGLALAHYSLGQVYAGMADFPRARPSFDEALRLEPKNVRWHMALGRLLSDMNDADGAIRAYGQATGIVHDYVPALIQLAMQNLWGGSSALARDKMQKAAKLAPQAYEPRLLQGEIELWEGNLDAALGHYQRSLALAPHNALARNAMAAAYQNMGECRKSADLLDSLIAERPHAAEYRVNLAYAYMCLEDYRAMLKSAEQAAALDPYSSLAHIAVAHALRALGRADEAIEAYGRAVAVSPDAGGIVAQLGDMLVEQQRYAEAESEYQTARRLGRDDLAAAGLCQTFASQNRWADALPECHDYNLMYPDEAYYAQTYAMAQAGSDQAWQGAASLDKLAKTAPDDAQLRLNLGIALVKAKQYKAAQAAYEKVMALVDEPTERDQTILSLLKGGWTLRESDALAQLQTAAKEAIQRTLRVQVTGKAPAERTLVMQILSHPSDTPESMTQAALAMTGFAAYFGPRIEPAADRVVVQQMDKEGKAYITITAARSDLLDFILGLLSEADLVNRLEFEMGAKQATTGAAEIERLGKEAAALRGLAIRKPISVTMITQETYNAEYKADLAEQTVGEEEASTALYRLLGALGPQDDTEQIAEDVVSEQVLGYYDPKTGALKVLANKIPSAAERMTIVHEYVHALQDQNFTALDDGGRDSDRRLALRALAEGDATVAAGQYFAENFGLEDYVRTLAAVETELDPQALAEAPSVLGQLFTFPYTVGAAFVQEAFDEGGWDAVDEFYASPPESTEQVLHSAKYRAGEPPVTVRLPKLAGPLAADWKPAGEDTLGEIGLWALLQMDLGPTLANTSAAGWGGDRYALLRHKDGSYALALNMAWDTGTDAQEFASLLRTALRHRKDFTERTDDLASLSPTRVFDGGTAWWVVTEDRKQVRIAIGGTRPVAEQIAAAYNK
jgi:tetratricopeptide (TPR) repeat protein